MVDEFGWSTIPGEKRDTRKKQTKSNVQTASFESLVTKATVYGTCLLSVSDVDRKQSQKQRFILEVTVF